MAQNKQNWKRVELGLKRLENSVEISLNRLQQHKKNIISSEKDGDRASVHAELKKAKQVISEISRNILTSQPLRRQLSEEDQIKFDTKLSIINGNVQEKVSEFKQLNPELVDFLGDDFLKRVLETGSEPTLEVLHSEVIPHQQTQLVQVKSQLAAELTAEDDLTEQTEQVESDIKDLGECMQQLHTAVMAQKDQVDSIEGNIETTHNNLKEGGKHLNKTMVIQAAAWPILGAGIGALIGGPIGLAAGLKIGLVAAGAGSVTGGLVGRKIEKKKVAYAEVELQNLQAASDTAETRKLRSQYDKPSDAS